MRNVPDCRRRRDARTLAALCWKFVNRRGVPPAGEEVSDVVGSGPRPPVIKQIGELYCGCFARSCLRDSGGREDKRRRQATHNFSHEVPPDVLQTNDRHSVHRSPDAVAGFIRSATFRRYGGGRVRHRFSEPLAFSGAISMVGTNALVAQLDRASDFDSEGREFESLRVRHFAVIPHDGVSRDVIPSRRTRHGGGEDGIEAWHLPEFAASGRR